MTVPSVESYHRDDTESEHFYGPLLPDADELHDEFLTREDRLLDHAPPNRAGWSPARSSHGLPPRTFPAPVPLGAAGTGDRT